jgi:hypothetical protein
LLRAERGREGDESKEKEAESHIVNSLQLSAISYQLSAFGCRLTAES